MKIMCLLTFLLMIQVSASVYSQNALLDIKLKNRTVRDVLKSIEAKSDFRFFYNDDFSTLNKRIDIDVSQKSIDEILALLLTEGNVTYKVMTDNLVVILPTEEYQKNRITGIVTDAATHEPLPGVNITVQGTTFGTITDVDGRYSIEVPGEKAILVFSFVGYISESIDIEGKKTLDIKLVADIQSLEEVVVVGYGTQKKVNLSGAVASIDVKTLSSRPISNISQGLQGVVPNLNIDFASGEPGKGASFNIRGFTSINGGEPLIIVDGIPVSTAELNKLNSRDIENISVLKDAASAAIYGARASFGVVLITTKSGKEKGVHVTYDGNYSWSKPTILPKPESDPYLSLTFAKEAARTWQYLFNPSQEILDYAKRRSEDPSLPSVIVNPNDPNVWSNVGNTDWYDFLLNDYSPMSDHTISVSGRGENIGYYFSGNYLRQEGLLKIASDNYKRYNLRSKIDFNLTKWLTLSNNTLIVQAERQQPSYSVTDFYYKRPIDVPYNPDGSWSDIEMAKLKDGGDWNYLENSIQSTFNFTASFFQNKLQFKGDYTFNRSDVKDIWNYKKVEYGAGPNVIRTSGSNTASSGNTSGLYNIINLYGTYTNTFGAHQITWLAGYNQEYKKSENFWAKRDDLISNDFPTLALATGEKNLGASYDDWAIRSLFSRINYILKDRYILEINGRYDGTSRFPKNSRFGIFPSVSTAWRLSEEPFMNFSKLLLSNLKFRLSYGTLGNQNVSSYGYLATMSSGNIGQIIGGTRPLAVFPPDLVSQNYTWETVISRNIGVDIGFLNGKFETEFDYYIRDTKDMLTKSKELPGVLGAGAPKENAADLQTAGWELTFNYKDQFTLAAKPFNIQGRFVISDNKAKITRFDNPDKRLSDYYEGYEIGTIWGLENDGFFNNADELANGPNQNWTSPWGQAQEVGWCRYKDQDGNKIINDGASTLTDHGDLKIIGNSLSRYRYGIDVSADWNGFDFRVFFQGVGKKDYYPQGYLFWGTFYKPYLNVYDHIKGHTWTEENKDAYFPRNTSWLADVSGKGLSMPQTRYLQDAGYLRLKNVTVGYSLPEGVTKKIRIAKVRIFVSADNVYEWTKLPDVFDPEAVTGDSWGWIYPFQRKYSVGINVNF